jgi:hypothetical protein
MKVTNYNDGKLFYREIIDSSYNDLKGLQIGYQERGNRTWMNLYRPGEWILTIELNGSEERVA